MGFQKGQSKPPKSGRSKGVKNKNKIIRIADFIQTENINLAQELYEAIQSIADPVAKTKALLDFYKFIDAPVKEREQTIDETEERTEAIQDLAHQSSDELIKLIK